jgi:hypothetical protein
LNGKKFPRCIILGGGVSMTRKYLHILKKLRTKNGDFTENGRVILLESKREVKY